MAKSSFFNPELMFTEYFTSSLEDMQTQLVSQWQDSVGTILDSFSTFTDITHQTVDQITQTHNDTLDYFYNSAGIQNLPALFPTTSAQQRKHVAVVTGGTGGIGTAICKRLYDDGNQVIATYIAMEQDRALEWQQKYKAKGYQFDLVECDVTDYRMCNKVARQIEKDFGRVDILVNCAGITRDATLRKMDKGHWDAVLKTNLNSVFNVTRSFINGMVKRNYGRIINISSVNGQKGQFGQTNYSAAKAGMIGFSRSLALELADSGITVNTVCPGYVGTDMVEAIPEDIKNKIIEQIPLGRLAKPSEIADAVAFLATEKCGYMTGSELSVNGGLYMG